MYICCFSYTQGIWKSPHSPSHTHWIKDALYFMKLQKIKHVLCGSTITFSKIWLPLLEHVRSLQLDIVPMGGAPPDTPPTS